VVLLVHEKARNVTAICDAAALIKGDQGRDREPGRAWITIGDGAAVFRFQCEGALPRAATIPRAQAEVAVQSARADH
jgi:hypothetical protein